jgi:hypothetical protein
MYDPHAVTNPVAMEWVSANHYLLPTDAGASFAIDASGEPLARIKRLGGQTLDQIQQRMGEMCDWLRENGGAGAVAEVAEFSRQMRVTLSLFLAPDVPRELRVRAEELDEWARGLPRTLGTWEQLRVRHVAIREAVEAREALVATRELLEGRIGELERLVTAEPAAGLEGMLGQLPPVEVIRPMAAEIRELTERGKGQVAELREAVGELEGMTPVTMADAGVGLFGAVMKDEAGRAAAGVAQAKDAGAAELAAAEALLVRGADEAAALARVVDWREYREYAERATKLEKQIMEWGAAAIQAYFVENDAGRFGPFEFEQALDLGGVPVAVRSLGAAAMEVVDVGSAEVLGSGDAGEVRVQLGGGGAAVEMLFRLTGRCDELALRLDELGREVGERLRRVVGPGLAGKSSWGKFSEAMGKPQIQQELIARHRRTMARWGKVIEDLMALGKFKERVATYYLLGWLGEAAPRFAGEVKRAKAERDAATDKVAAIVAASGRERGTGRLIVPEKFAQEYPQRLEAREDANARVAYFELLLDVLAGQVRRRLGTAKLLGSAVVPELAVIPCVGEEMTALAAHMTAGKLLEMINALEAVLGAGLRPDGGLVDEDVLEQGAIVGAEEPAAEDTPNEEDVRVDWTSDEG